MKASHSLQPAGQSVIWYNSQLCERNDTWIPSSHAEMKLHPSSTMKTTIASDTWGTGQNVPVEVGQPALAHHPQSMHHSKVTIYTFRQSFQQNDSRYSFHQEIVLLSQSSVLALFQYSYWHLLGSDSMFVLNKNRRPSLSLPTVLCSLSGAVDILSAAIASVSKCIPEIFWSAVSCHSKEHYIIIDRQMLQVMP